MTVEAARDALADLTDPEIPVLTLDDLGILRDVRVAADGAVEVDITPTYSGCPAMEAIRADVVAALASRGLTARVRTVLAPAWTTDWMSDQGRRKLVDYGIAPPGRRAPAGPVLVPLGRRPGSGNAPVACPRCGSTATEELSRFASTACKSLWRCTACREPFDYFKPL